MSNDVKVTHADVDAVKAILAATGFSRAGAPVTTTACEVAARHRTRHQPQEREAVLEDCDIAWLWKVHTDAQSKGLHADQRKIERILAALTTPAPAAVSRDEALIRRIEYILDPTASAKERASRRAHLTNHDLRTILSRLEVAPAECPSCHGLNTSCPEGCGRDPETGELNGTLLTPTDQALLADIFAKMAEVLKPLPGELSEGDEA